jgi:hypothetical protein
MAVKEEEKRGEYSAGPSSSAKMPMNYERSLSSFVWNVAGYVFAITVTEYVSVELRKE